jgi:hypothetical protein
MVTQSLLNQYRREVESASNDARNYLIAVTKAYLEENPSADVAEIRNFAIRAIQDGVNVFGDQAKVIANDFFDTLAEQNGSKATSEIFDTLDAGMMEDKVHYYARSIAEGNIDKFIDDISNLTGYYVKREAFCNMAKNCNKQGLRYARVPSGKETCAFCFMLCSRGFVYWTEKTAGGEGYEYHTNCDCIIVPGFYRGYWNMEAMDDQVEGYTPSELYARYKQCSDVARKTAGGTPTEEQILEEIKKRDTQWLWTGKSSAKETITRAEYAKITSAINTVYKARFEGKTSSIFYYGDYGYKIKINNFDDYEIERKWRIE